MVWYGVNALNALNVIQHDQPRIEGVGRCGHVRQVERRPHEGKSLGERFQRLQGSVDAVAMFHAELAKSDCVQVDAR